MKKQIAEGRQCYVICPMVEESESMEAENVIDYAGELQKEMGDSICVSYLPVSYTHLDVYKRQVSGRANVNSGKRI